ncbi:MAG: class I SAM-dependent methyltransferase [Eubacteriales bacterium]|nr:class I SAM-dependent methyltransferase [Eubacteriales bacterium]
MQDNRMHLTPRLRTIMEQVPDGARIADIGTDHALIPAALLRRGKIVSAVASDIRQGPLESAARTARQFGLSDSISLRLGAGLRTVKPSDADTIIIAGMGGETIAQILTDDPWALKGEHLLLLQPMTAQPYLRKYLAAHGGKIIKETLCREGRRMYTVLTVRGGGEKTDQALSDCCVSDALLCDSMAAEYLVRLLEREEKIAASLEAAKHQKPEELALHRANVQVLKDALCQIRKDR